MFAADLPTEIHHPGNRIHICLKLSTLHSNAVLLEDQITNGNTVIPICRESDVGLVDTKIRYEISLTA